LDAARCPSIWVASPLDVVEWATIVVGWSEPIAANNEIVLGDAT
jgi:hypothetical protein